MFNTISRIAAFGAVALLGAQPAWAIDADQFGARLKDTVRLLGIAIDYGSASAQGDTVTLSDFTIFIPGENNARLPDDVVFSGVAEIDDGGFTVKTATIADLELDDPEEGFSLSLRDVAVEGITLPGSIDDGNLLSAAMTLYRSASAGPLTVSRKGAEIFAIDSFLTTVDGPLDTGAYTSHLAVEGIRADLSAIPDPEAQALIAAFGTGQFSADLTGDSDWNLDTGRAGISDFTFTIEGQGSITMDGTVIGYDRAFARDFMEANLDLAELARTGGEISEDEMVRIEQDMLDQIAAVGIEGFAVRYNDNSLFMKVLDMIAAEQGVDGRTFASGLKFIVAMALVDLADVDLRKSLTTAVSAFLDDPRNFTVSAEPDAPVSVTALENAKENPQALIELLNITVTANQ